MIDLHCHLLPGIDDGPSTIDGALELAHAQVIAGIETVAATPHVAPAFPNSAAVIADGLAMLRERLTRAEVPLRVVSGAEVDLLMAVDELPDDELAGLTLHRGQWLLVEAPLRLHPDVELSLRALLVRGHRVLLAHPERSPAFHRDPAALGRLARDGVLMQITAGVLIGRYGGTAQRFAARMIDEQLVHVVASDAHDCLTRGPGLRTALLAAGLGERCAWLTEEVPSALLAGAAVPKAPSSCTPHPRTYGLRRHRSR